MFNKLNFSDYFVLGSLFAFTFGIFRNIWTWARSYPSYILIIIQLQAIALALYSIFIENEIPKANSYYKAILISFITGYESIKTIRSIILLKFGICYTHLSLVWVVFSLALFTKFPNFLTKIYRFCIGFTLLHSKITLLPFPLPYPELYEIIPFVLALLFIFIKYLTFDRISVLSSYYLYYWLLVLGLAFVIFGLLGFNAYQQVYYTIAKVVAGIVLVSGLCFKYKRIRSGEGLLEGEQASYNTV